MAGERHATTLPGAVFEAFEPFWVGGLALLQLGAVSLWPGLRLQGERYEWIQYLLLGTLFPAAVLTLTLLARGLGGTFQAAAGWARLALAAFGAAAAGWFVVGQASAAVLLLATANWATLAAVEAWGNWGRGTCGDDDGMTTSPVGWAATWVLLAVGWSVAVRVCFWEPFETRATRTPWASAALGASVFLVSAALGFRGRSAAEARARPRWGVSAADILAVLLAVPAAFRIDSLGGPDPFPDTVGLGQFAFFHWGPIVGPAELVRQGGWPLWDVPCQYGLLNTVIVAWTPFQSVWQSLYVVNSALTAGAALILYAILRSAGRRAGRLGGWFALAASFAAVFLVTGDLRLSSGPSIGPSLGAYRFFWCYALVGVLAWGLRAGHGQDGPPGRRVLALGCLAWLAGTFWSCESATYCAAAWLPAFAWMVWARAAATASAPGRLRAAAWLVVPPLSAAVVVGLTSAYYVARLGHAPDWRAYFDYSFANITRQAAPMDASGAVWAPVIVLLVLSALAAHLFDRGRAAGALGLVAGAWGSVWATCSYFVARSDQGAVVNLSPIACLALAAAWLVLERLGPGDRPRAPVRAAFVPFLVVILSLAYGDPVHLPRWSRAWRRVYTGAVDRLLPRMTPELAALLDRAGVGRDDPVCYLDDSFLLNAIPVRPGGPPSPPASASGPGSERWRDRAWLPTLPFSLFAPLPGDRGRVYLARFAARSKLGGWLVEPRAPSVPPEALGWFYESLSETHAPAPGAPAESPHWRVTRYEPRGALLR